MENLDGNAGGVAQFFPKHASRALQHGLKIKNHDILICKAVIPEGCCNLYLSLYEGGVNQREARKCSKEEVDASVASSQSSVVEALLGTRNGAVVSGQKHSSSVTNFLHLFSHQ